MRHDGYVWVAADPNSGWDRGAVDLRIDSVVVQIGDATVRTWPIHSVRLDPGEDDTTVFSVAGDRVYMRPDDARALEADLVQLPTPMPAPPPAPPAPAPLRSTATGSQLARPAAEKNPGIAAVLSFLLSGLGQIYNGQIGKGVAFIGIQIVNAFLTVILIGFVTGFAVWVWSMVDAYQSAERINRQLSLA